jgi:hypothetical protein
LSVAPQSSVLLTSRYAFRMSSVYSAVVTLEFYRRGFAGCVVLSQRGRWTHLLSGVSCLRPVLATTTLYVQMAADLFIRADPLSGPQRMDRAGSASDQGSCYATDLPTPTSLHARVPLDAEPECGLIPARLRSRLRSNADVVSIVRLSPTPAIHVGPAS